MNNAQLECRIDMDLEGWKTSLPIDLGERLSFSRIGLDQVRLGIHSDCRCLRMMTSALLQENLPIMSMKGLQNLDRYTLCWQRV